MDWGVSPQEDFPMIVCVLHDWGEAGADKGEVFPGLEVPVDFYLFSFSARKMLNLINFDFFVKKGLFSIALIWLELSRLSLLLLFFGYS